MMKKFVLLSSLMAFLAVNSYAHGKDGENNFDDGKRISRLGLSVRNGESNGIKPRAWIIDDIVSDSGVKGTDGKVDLIRLKYFDDYAFHLAPGIHKFLSRGYFRSGSTREMPEKVRNLSSCLMEYAEMLNRMMPVNGKHKSLDVACLSCTYESKLDDENPDIREIDEKPEPIYEGSITSTINFINRDGLKRRFILQDLDDDRGISCIVYTFDEEGVESKSQRYSSKLNEDLPNRVLMPPGLEYLSNLMIDTSEKLYMGLAKPVKEVPYDKRKR